MNRFIVFTDIDDTLMTTPRKLTSSEGLAPGAVRPDGKVTSYREPQHQALWDHLVSKADVAIPVTARSLETYRRLTLAFHAEAVLDFGATVLTTNGLPDTDWLEKMQAQSAKRQTASLLATLQGELVAALKLPPAQLTTELRVSPEGVPCFLNFRFSVADKPLGAATVLRWLKAQELRSDVYLHESDRDVTLLPLHVSKRAAVQHVIAHYGYQDDLRIGMGDSLSDVPFMQECHFHVLPTPSRAAASLGGIAYLESTR